MSVLGSQDSGRRWTDTVRDNGEIFEATVFLQHFNDLTDIRQQAKVVYPLGEVLPLATLAGAEAFEFAPKTA